MMSWGVTLPRWCHQGYFKLVSETENCVSNYRQWVWKTLALTWQWGCIKSLMSCIMGIVGASVFNIRNLVSLRFCQVCRMYFYYSLKYCFLSPNFNWQAVLNCWNSPLKGNSTHFIFLFCVLWSTHWIRGSKKAFVAPEEATCNWSCNATLHCG